MAGKLGLALHVAKGESRFDEGYTEAGLQLRYYLLGMFTQGMPVGLKLLAHTFIVEEDAFSVYAQRYVDKEETYAAVTINPLIGYKHMFVFGITVEAALGASLSAHPRYINSAFMSLDVGWTFPSP